jgi:hypothetical protein
VRGEDYPATRAFLPGRPTMTISGIRSWSQGEPSGSDPLAQCIRCGARRGPDDVNCSQCTWPFHPDGWPRTTRRIRRVTSDTSCVNAKQQNDDLNQLERWERSGWLHLQRADALLNELRGEARIAKASTMAPHPDVFVLGASSLGGDNVLAGELLDPAFLARLMFPTTSALLPNHQHDIDHLRQHVRTGGDAFVTLDGDFLDERRRSLQQIGIWTFRPEQLVAHLRAGYGQLPPEALRGP